MRTSQAERQTWWKTARNRYCHSPTAVVTSQQQRDASVSTYWSHVPHIGCRVTLRDCRIVFDWFTFTPLAQSKDHLYPDSKQFSSCRKNNSSHSMICGNSSVRRRPVPMKLSSKPTAWKTHWNTVYKLWTLRVPRRSLFGTMSASFISTRRQEKRHSTSILSAKFPSSHGMLDDWHRLLNTMTTFHCT